MAKNKLVLSSLLLLLSSLSHSSTSFAAVTRNYHFEVAQMFWSPDCFDKVVIGINGQFPGPTIRARAGDTLVIKVTNKLETEGTVIHWHGIKQRGTPWADGTASISQCPINPKETFVYRFIAEKAGTYFYHGHYGMQRTAGLYGSLIVDVAEGEQEPFDYHGDLIMLFSDWWHQATNDQMVGLDSVPLRWIGEPQALLINGKGQFNCSLAAKYGNGSLPQCKNLNPQCSPFVFGVLPNKTYRLRIISTTSLSSLNLIIGNHKMLIVEADGNYVQPVKVESLDIYSGQSYSVLVTTDQNSEKNYWISLAVIGRQPKTQPALTILNYQTISSSTLPSSSPPEHHPWNDFARIKAFSSKILAKEKSPMPPQTFDRRIIMLNTQNKFSGRTKWAINNITLLLTSTPYLGSLKYGLKNAIQDKTPADQLRQYDVFNPPQNPNTKLGNGLYKVILNSTVDVILQNANTLTANNSEIHPWHLHGHDFWVLGYGEGKFSQQEYEKLNTKNPPLRNTEVVFPYGWTALRFRADNPGVWPFHCHIEPHLHMAMGVVFAEGLNLVGDIPHEALACGMTAMMMNISKP